MGELEKLAMISDGLQQILPESKTTIILELRKEVFTTISMRLNTNGSADDKKFKIDISGISFYFISEEAEL